MKPDQAARSKERLARLKLRKWARRIPDNAVLTNILLQMEKPFRGEFYRRVAPLLKFRPIPLESIDVI